MLRLSSGAPEAQSGKARLRMSGCKLPFATRRARGSAAGWIVASMRVAAAILALVCTAHAGFVQPLGAAHTRRAVRVSSQPSIAARHRGSWSDVPHMLAMLQELLFWKGRITMISDLV